MTITSHADELRAIRTKLNLTQEQLAERLGVSFATVNRWEGGANAPQKAAREVIAALAREAGLDDVSSADSAVDSAAGVTRRRRGRAAASSSTRTMEQMLWDAACSIRGEKDAPKFKDYLLPLLFLKRLSDVFDDEIARLAEDYGDPRTALEIAEADHSLLRFYLPPEARWAAINGREPFAWSDAERPRDIGEHLTKAVRAVVKHNPSLSGVIDVVDFAAERNGERDINPAKLRDVVETYSDPRYRLGLADVQPDFLGRAYEYLLRKFAEGSGQSAGEFFTPTEVGFLMAHIMRPKPGEDCHDYACGSAGLLVKLQLVARELDPTSRVPLKLTGQELQAESYAVAKMNGIIHDMTIELARGDTMINPKFRTADGRIRTHDIVVANPMWNQPFAPDVFANDPFDRFRTAGGITTGKGDWAWLQHTLACLNDRGRAAVVLDSGAVTRGSGSKNEDKERNIRRWFVEQDLIEGVILLPDNLFYNTNAAGLIVVLNRRKPASKKDRIVLMNASRAVKKGQPKNFIPEHQIRLLAATFLRAEAIEGQVAVITREQAAEADFNLSPSRWVSEESRASAINLSGLVQELKTLSEIEVDTTTSLLQVLVPLSTAGAPHSETQKESSVGRVPTSWEVTDLGSLCSTGNGRIQTGPFGSQLHADEYQTEGVAVVNPTHLDGNRINHDDVPRLSAQTVARLDRHVLKRGDILFARRGEIGRLGLVGEAETGWLCGTGCFLVRVDDPRVDSAFLARFFSREEVVSWLSAHAAGAIMPNLNGVVISRLPVAIPTLSEQKEIVGILDAIEQKIDIHKKTSAILDDLFESLLHKLMTGEIRVADMDLLALEQTTTAPMSS